MGRIVDWLVKSRLMRLVFAIPLLSTLICGMIFFEMLNRAEMAVLDNTKLEKRLDIDTTAEKMDLFILADDDWDIEYDYYNTSIIYSMELLDMQPGTFAAAYDSSLRMISAEFEQAGEAHIDPLQYAEFVDAVDAYESGELSLPIRVDKGYSIPEGSVDWYFYYRWIPTDHNLEGRFLAVVGIPEVAVTAGIARGLSVWVSIMLIITAIVNLLMVAVIARHVAGPKRVGSRE